MLVMSQMNEVTAPTSGSSQGWSPHLLTIVVLPILPSARELGCFLLLASHVKAMKTQLSSLERVWLCFQG